MDYETFREDAVLNMKHTGGPNEYNMAIFLTREQHLPGFSCITTTPWAEAYKRFVLRFAANLTFTLAERFDLCPGDIKNTLNLIYIEMEQRRKGTTQEVTI